MSTPPYISSTGASVESPFSIEQEDRGPYGVPHAFTLADSFYDASASDVFLKERTEHPMSVEPPEYIQREAEPAVKKDDFQDSGSLRTRRAALWPESTLDYDVSEQEPLYATVPQAPAYVPQAPIYVQPAPAYVNAVSTREVVEKQSISPEQRMVDSFQIPIFATLVFVITMIAIYYLGSQVAGYYAPVVRGGEVEFVGRPSPTL